MRRGATAEQGIQGRCLQHDCTFRREGKVGANHEAETKPTIVRIDAASVSA